MGLYTDTIVKREENNRKIEQYADDSLTTDRSMRRIESEMDDIETAALYILDKFGIRLSRQFGQTSIAGLLNSMLDPLGMMYEYFESAEEKITGRTEYILAIREDGKAVAITPSFRGYRWFCPYDSQTGRVTKAWCRTLRPGCYVFNRPLEMKKSTIATFIVNVVKNLTIYDLLCLTAATLLVSLFGLAVPKISQWVFNVYLQDAAAHMTGFAYALILFLLVNLIRGGLSLAKSLVLSMIKTRVSMKMQSAVMAKVLHLPQSFFRDNSSGKLSKRISSCGKLSDLILSIFLDILLDFSFSGIYLSQMRRLAPELYGPAVLFLAAKIAVSVISALSYLKNESSALEVEMENSSFLYSAIRGIQKIKGMGAEKPIYGKWAELYRMILHYDYNQPFFLKHQDVLLSAISSLATVCLLQTASAGAVSREDYLTFSASYALMITVITSLTNMMRNVFQLQMLSKNVDPIFRAASEQPEASEYVRKLRGDILIDNVFFQYPDSQKGCLRGVSLHISPGEKIAIAGISGCGKSSLLRLLIGFERADQGMIFFDGRPITSLNLTSLRQNIGSVFQFSRLIPGTIETNVTLNATKKVSESAVWDALDKAAIGDEIRKLPLKLETEISESNSSGFSGGQRQRILLARAYINNPDILILDEATSALDNITQSRVLDAILAFRQTVIMVAHRLTTVKDFDRIILLEDGKITEEGTYQDLMDRNGHFAGLVRKQLLKTGCDFGEDEP